MIVNKDMILMRFVGAFGAIAATAMVTGQGYAQTLFAQDILQPEAVR